MYVSKAPPIKGEEALRYWLIFSLLARCRGHTEAGPTPIVYSEIIAYMNEEDILDPEERKDIIFFVKNLDSDYISIINDMTNARIEAARRKNG